MNDIILALDPARRTGIAIGAPGQRPYLSTVNFAREFDDPADVFARALRWIGRAIEYGTDGERLWPWCPTLLAIEAPIPPSRKIGSTNFSTTLIAIGLSAIFRGTARAHGIPILLAPIGTWRKYALGHGNLKGRDAKAGMMRLVRSLGWGDDIQHDAAEAAGIWLYAGSLIAPQTIQRTEPLFVHAGSYAEQKVGT